MLLARMPTPLMLFVSPGEESPLGRPGHRGGA